MVPFYSGGSSSKTRRQITAARRAAAMLARALLPASTPLQSNLLTISFSIPGLRPYLSRLEAVADRRHHKFLGLVEVCVGGGDWVEDPAREQLLDRAVERHRGEHRRHVVTEGAGGL